MDLARPDPPFDPYRNSDWPSYPARYQNPSRVSSLDGCAIFSGYALSRLRTNCRVRCSILSPGVRIEDGGLIESSVLMPRVWVGKDVRIRRAIIEEGVHIPPGFQIGFDLENDRKHYFVTDAGVVVVSQTPKHSRPTAARSPRIGPKPVIASNAA